MVSTSNCNVPTNAVWFMTLQVWNNDVRFYCVKNLSDVPIAYFYFDPYSRPHGKRGGAWVDLVVGRSRVVSHDATSCRLPVVHIVCNQTPPLAGKPSLMTFREVGSAFHLSWKSYISVSFDI
jgi:oligopeptidase A